MDDRLSAAFEQASADNSELKFPANPINTDKIIIFGLGNLICFDVGKVRKNWIR